MLLLALLLPALGPVAPVAPADGADHGEVHYGICPSVRGVARAACYTTSVDDPVAALGDDSFVYLHASDDDDDHAIELVELSPRGKRRIAVFDGPARHGYDFADELALAVHDGVVTAGWTLVK